MCEENSHCWARNILIVGRGNKKNWEEPEFSNTQLLKKENETKLITLAGECPQLFLFYLFLLSFETNCQKIFTFCQNSASFNKQKSRKNIYTKDTQLFKYKLPVW